MFVINCIFWCLQYIDKYNLTFKFKTYIFNINDVILILFVFFIANLIWQFTAKYFFKKLV